MITRKGRGQRGGWIQLLILRVLFETPLHGYALNEKVNSLLAGRRPIKPGSLYTILRRMEKAGMLVSEWDKETSRLNRRVYNLTEKGKQILTDGYFKVEEQKRILDEMTNFYKEHFPELESNEEI
jgi:DNA-binding PadR family transcriptional regulator